MAATATKLHNSPLLIDTNTTIPLNLRNGNHSKQENKRRSTPAIVIIVSSCFVVFRRDNFLLPLAAPREFARSQFFAVLPFFRFFGFSLFRFLPFFHFFGRFQTNPEVTNRPIGFMENKPAFKLMECKPALRFDFDHPALKLNGSIACLIQRLLVAFFTLISCFVVVCVAGCTFIHTRHKI